MSPDSTPTTGPMNNPQPRRYKVRSLHDVVGLTQQEIAAELDISQTTVQRDLSETVAPVAKTPRGAPVYPPGRFNDDPEYQERVERLMKQYPETTARRLAAREFAGEAVGPKPRMRGQIERIRTEAERNHLLRAFDEANRGAAVS